MTIFIPVKFLIIVGVAVGMALCMWVATMWLLAPEPGLHRAGGKMKRYQVYAEVTVTREVAIVFAESEEAAVEQARNAAESIAHDMGADNTEIVWAEEKTE